MINVEVLCAAGNELGESPVWLKARSEIIWLDLTGRILHCLHYPSLTLTKKFIDIQGPLGAIVPSADPNCVLLTAPGLIGHLDLASGTITNTIEIEAGREDMICNDSKVDRAGRLWFGTCERAEVEPRGILYCLTQDAVPVLADAGFIVPNGPAFSPDGSILYFSDSLNRRILAYDVVEKDIPKLTNRRVFAHIEPRNGLPDGLTVDSDGGLWCACWGGSVVLHYAPSGALMNSIAVPALYVTSLAFGGPNFDELFVTTAKPTGVDARLTEFPAAGNLLRFQPGVRGIEEASCSVFKSLRKEAPHASSNVL